MLKKLRMIHPEGLNVYLSQNIRRSLSGMKTEVKLINRRGMADAKNILELLEMEIKVGEEFVVSAVGSDENKAIRYLDWLMSDKGVRTVINRTMLQLIDDSPKACEMMIVYGSTTGNTRRLAEDMSAELHMVRQKHTLKNIRDLDFRQLQEKDVLVFGCSTWEEGRLQADFEDFEQNIRGLALKGKQVTVFGPGQDVYSKDYCKAVAILEEILQDHKATLVTPSLTIDGDIDIPNRFLAKSWIRNVFRAVKPGRTLGKKLV